MNTKSRLSEFSRSLWLTLGMFVVVCITFGIYAYLEKQVDHANELRLQSFLLADELRQSSDDLTRMVRTYVVTGDPIYKQHYQEILDIRDGRKPRPVAYNDVYWDLVLSDDRRPRPNGQAVPLLELMRQAGFTESEFAKLAQAKANSDRLTNTEFAAMALIESKTPATEANRLKATRMLNDEAYHQAKYGIMRPISEFYQMMDQRTLETVQAAEKLATLVRVMLSAFGLLLAYTLWRAYRALLATLGCSVDELQGRIARLGRGDFSSGIPVAPGMENSVLGWLSATQVNLAKIDAERKQTEEVIREASKYSRSLIEASMDPLVMINAEGKITDVNIATESATGVHRVNLIGSDFADFFTDPGKARKGYQQVFSQGFVTNYPLALRHVSGKVTDVLYNASVYRNESGEVLGVFAAARDVTERKKAEEALRESEGRFKTIFNEAPLGIALIDSLTGRIYNVNPMFARITGRTMEQVANIDWMSITHPDDVQKDLDNMALLNAGKIAGFQMEKRYLRLDGTVVWINMTIAPLKVEAKAMPSHLCMIEDITARKLVEEELRRYKDHLEEEVQQRTADLVLALNSAEAANRAKSVFLSSMSHELRTPLNAILGFSSMMRKDSLLSQEQRENLDIINRSGEHLLALINDVLEMAKIEAGRMQLENAPFDLGVLVRDVTDMMQVRAQEKGLQLLIEQSSKFPRYIKGDGARLRQILINLVGNAVKFTQEGGITVRFGMKPHAAQQRLLIEVEDSGIGIKPEDQEKIFEPFVQSDEVATQMGTGLGLTITRQYVQLMGGTISVESTPDKGSTFRVELPADRVAQADVLKLAKVESHEVAETAPGQPEYRILIVEDQLENQLLLTKLMENIGFPVKVAENGERALELFQSWRPHLIWMDWRMPVMDGVEATRRIRKLPGGKEVKIVAVTASAFTEQRDEMLMEGMDDIVRKPYRFDEIYECLTQQLGVQYFYNAEIQAVEEVSDGVLTAQMLAALPQNLRRELHDALESLESERIAAVIQRVAAYDSKLHNTLSHLARNFDYPAILKALQTDQQVNVT